MDTTTKKIRRSKRLNVVQSSEPYANGNHNSDEQVLPQCEPVLQAQALGDDDIQVEQQDDDDLNLSGQEDGVKKRGETLLPYVWNLQEGKRIVVQCNKLGQPIGREGGVLGQFLGTLARNGGYCPLSMNDWRLIRKDSRDKTILQFVQTKFLYPRSCDKWILKSIGRDWRQYKATLKKTLFNVKKKRYVLYRRCPKDVDEDQWVALVNHWKSKKGKVLSERNKRSRAMRKTNHTAGAMSYARWAEDLRQKDPEKEQPHRAKVYIATHKEKSKHGDGHVAELKNLIDDQPELGENNQGRVAWEGDALHKVLGEEKPGQVHGMGLLPDSKLFYGRTSYHLKQVNITTIDGSSSDVDTHVLEKVGKLEEHVKKQDKLIQDLVKKLACRENIELAEVNTQTNYYDNFQSHPILSKRKRVECNVSDLNNSFTEQDTLRHEDLNIKVVTHQEASSSCSADDFPCEQRRNSIEHRKNMAVQQNKKHKQLQDTMKKRQEKLTHKKIRLSAMEFGTTVLLKSANRYPNKEHVAYATFLSSDPDAQVGGFKLGNQFWKVRVNYPIEEHEVLVRPWENYKTIGQTKGKAIAWPSICVEKINS